MDCLNRIKAIFRQVHDFEQALCRDYGITLNEAMLICSLTHDVKSAGEISSDVEISASRASRVLLSLERKGLVERSFCNDDKRRMMFKLTQDGHNKRSEIKDIDKKLNFKI